MNKFRNNRHIITVVGKGKKPRKEEISGEGWREMSEFSMRP